MLELETPGCAQSKRSRSRSIPALALFMKALLASSMPFLSMAALASNAEARIKISPDWDKIVGVSKANVSIQVCPEPPMRRGYPIHDQLFRALHDLGADYARLQPWFPYPKMTVAELRPPENGKTFWDFTLMDQITEDFMLATAGHPVVFDFGTVPRWMFTTKTPTRYPANPDDIDWSYVADKELNDSTVQRFAEYQARLAGWYIKGGFEDEVGEWHASGHHYNVDYWEVLDEPDGDNLTPAQYTQFYDAVVEAVRKVVPGMKFIGPALTPNVIARPDYMIYFLDPKNHGAGIPVDMVSYHFYSLPDSDETPEVMQHTIFAQADQLMSAAQYVEALRAHFAPNTRTAVNELGSELPGGLAPKLLQPIPKTYWNLAGAMWAYTFGKLATLGIDVVNAAELIDYPGQVASSTLVDWDTGKPNARYWVVKLLRDNFGPGDQIVGPPEAKTATDLAADPGFAAEQIYAQAFISPSGERKILLVNKRDRPLEVTIPGIATGFQQRVDQNTVSAPIKQLLSQDILRMPGLAVTIVTLQRSDSTHLTNQ